MPLPKTSPDMSPMPTTVIGSAAGGVAAHLTQMALGGFPCTARRDAHLLVVVAVLAAGGEGVAQPEAPR